MSPKPQPAVRLAGACSLRLRLDGRTAIINVPKLNPDGGNNADVLIDRVLRFAILRHGTKGVRKIVRELLSGYPEKNYELGQPEPPKVKRRNGITMQELRPSMAVKCNFKRADVALTLARVFGRDAVTAADYQLATTVLKWGREDGVILQSAPRSKFHNFVLKFDNKA